MDIIEHICVVCNDELPCAALAYHELEGYVGICQPCLQDAQQVFWADEAKQDSATFCRHTPPCTSIESDYR